MISDEAGHQVLKEDPGNHRPMSLNSVSENITE